MRDAHCARRASSRDAFDGAFVRLASDRRVQVALRYREVELRASVATRHELRDQPSVQGIQLELLGAVDALAVQRATEMCGILVRVDDDARRGLARLVQTRGVGNASVW